MFGELRIFDCRIFLLLVICILQLYLSKSVEESIVNGSETSDNVIVCDAGKQLCSVPKKKRCSNTLRAVIAQYYKDKWKREDTISRRVTENRLVPNLSLMKDAVGIEVTSIYNEIESTPTVDSSRTESNFPSSQPSTIISNKLEDDDNPEADLNRTKTFQVDSEIESSNATKELQQQHEDFQIDQSDSKVSIEPPQEDIPSFREWTEKHLAEKEKERASIGDDNATNVPTNGHKMRKKNFASLDCGAKLVSTNPEAKSAGSLLSTSRDEYLLSVCNTKIWFVVELCEAVQLKRVELANFELFSSSPKEFSVSIADRFPSRDWTVVGQFTAKDEKSIQSFDLQQNHFTKYIKIEFHSHYGKEHFCPISLFRVYGTSEFEVLETVDNEEVQTDTIESDYDANEPIMSEIDNRKRKLEANNLFGSAKEAVMNIVKKAAEVLIPSSNNSTLNSTRLSNFTACKSQIELETNHQCVTPRYVILCQDCGESFFNKLFYLISCYAKGLDQILQMDLIWKPLIKYDVCSIFGITSSYLRGYSTTLVTNENFHHNDMYFMYLFPREIIAALCNLVAISENRLKQNVTLDKTLPLNQTSKKCNAMNVELKQSTYETLYPINDDVIAASVNSKLNPATVNMIEHASGTVPSPENQFIGSYIRPTRTIVPTDDNDVNVKAQPQASIVDELPQVIASAASSIPIHVPIFPNVVSHEQIKTTPEELEVGKEPDHLNETIEDSMSLDSLISELEKTEATNLVHPATPKPSIQKESVFVKLANRIKALERNMSLSGQYLDELSRRYKKQVEDMQRVLSEVTVRETKLSQEVNLLTTRISLLTRSVDGLTVTRDSWSYKALRVGEHSLILFLEIVIFIGIVCLCRGIPRVEISKRKFSLEWRRGQDDQTTAEKSLIAVKRRQSLDDLSMKKSKQQHKRRPSEEAMRVDCTTHQDLLIYETNRSSKAESRRRKRKRKELLLKSNANAINLETGDVRHMTAKKLAAVHKSNAPLSRSASASEIDEHSWGRHVYAGMIDRENCEQQLIEQKENVALPEENDFRTIFQTATSVRTKRLSINQFNDKNVLSPVYDVSSEQDSSVPSTPIKEKKLNIRKIMKKFF